jgi:hypothetical protein
MSLHINKFIELVKACEARGQRDLHMPLRDARDLHADITRLLGQLQELHDSHAAAASDTVIQVEVTGGSFKNT